MKSLVAKSYREQLALDRDAALDLQAIAKRTLALHREMVKRGTAKHASGLRRDIGTCGKRLATRVTHNTNYGPYIEFKPGYDLFAMPDTWELYVKE